METLLKYIQTIDMCGSFAEAAKILHVTPPALSIAVRKEEERIGMPLFDRTARPLRLTRAGVCYASHIEQLSRLEQSFADELQDVVDFRQGTLRVGGTQYVNSFLLPPVLGQFLVRYPEARVELTEGNSDRSIALLAEGRLDLTFGTEAARAEGINAVPAFHDQLLLAVPECFPVNRTLAGYALSHAAIAARAYGEGDSPAVPLRTFADTPMVFLSEKNNLYRRACRICADAGFVPQIRLQVDQFVTSYHIAQSGIGAVFVSDQLIAMSVPAPMVYYRIAHAQVRRTFYALSSRVRFVPQVVRRFLCFFQSMRED